MNLELIDSAKVADQQTQGSSCVRLLCLFTGVGFYSSVGDQNSGVHACTMALTEPSHHLWNFLFIKLLLSEPSKDDKLQKG